MGTFFFEVAQVEKVMAQEHHQKQFHQKI